MRGAIPPLPQYAFMVWCSVKEKGRDNFNFTLIILEPGYYGEAPHYAGSSSLLDINIRVTTYYHTSSMQVMYFFDARHQISYAYKISSLTIYIHARAHICLIQYEGVSQSFRTGRVEWELQMVQLSATKCSCIATLWVSIVSFAAITLFVASQRVFIVVSLYFFIDSVRKRLDTSYISTLEKKQTYDTDSVLTAYAILRRITIPYFNFIWNEITTELTWNT
jgi:hypothetical protein